MTLLGRLGLSPESQALEGTPDEVDARGRAAHDEKLRPARIEAARRISGWREIADDLAPRLGGRWPVAASDDRIYAPYRGVVWVADSIVPMADTVDLCFYVSDADELHFFKRVKRPATWSEYVRRQTEKRLQKTASGQRQSG